MAKVALPVTTFQNPDGTPVANGYILIRLNNNGKSSDGKEVQYNFVKNQLDSNGTLTGSPLFWKNSDILPLGSYYIVMVYSAVGQLISGPLKITVL
jgi:hypothetical protein